MKIAVLADIHANLSALEAVADSIASWQPDQVILAGDIVNRGPSPEACLQFVHNKIEDDGWHVIKGNHEDYVLSHLEPEWPRTGPAYEIRRNAHWTFDRVTPYLAWMGSLADEFELVGPAGSQLRAVHASMLNNRAGIFAKTPDDELRKRIAPAPTVLAVGHTHHPLIREIDETLVVNAGSVGLPFDEDQRAAYAQITHTSQAGWQAEISRVPYDTEATIRQIFDSGFYEGGGDLVRIMLQESRFARSLIFQWVVGFQERVLADEMPIADSVTQYLEELGLPTH